MTFLINKSVGLTPFDCIKLFQQKFPEQRNRKLAYAGRLDPMAEGLLLVLVGDETKSRTKYQNLDKKYEFKVLFGVSTDTFDLMGIPKVTKGLKLKTKNSERAKIKNILNGITKQTTQPYPPYSSKTVNGKPLYWYARNGKLDSIEIPSKLISIYDLKLIRIKLLKTKDLKKRVNLIRNVQGDFRQKEILRHWGKLFEKLPNNEFQIAKFVIHCSSGTYVRQIAHDMGRLSRYDALAYSIKRTRIGDYQLKDAVIL